MRLHLHEWGDRTAQPLVCLHGVMGHGRRFRNLAEERLSTRFHILAPDLRGHGHSGWDQPWNIDTFVADVLETLDARPAAWIGHSFGGRLVMEVGARKPSLVERVVLLDPVIRVPANVSRQLAAQERNEKSFATVEEAIEKQIEFGPIEHTPRDFIEEEMRDHLVLSPDGRYRYRYSQEAVATIYEELISPPPPLEAIGVPTLLVVGQSSKLVSAADAELYRAALGDLFQIVVVPGSHLVLWDAFEETAAAIEAFLAGQP